jgi:uncharacterized membrane protein
MRDEFTLWLFVGIVFIGMSIPLILQKVTPNSWYGFRVAKTFSSEEIWYVANRVAGYDWLWAGIAIIITAVMTRLFGHQLNLTTAHTINFVVFISAILMAMLHSFISLNQL